MKQHRLANTRLIPIKAMLILLWAMGWSINGYSQTQAPPENRLQVFFDQLKMKKKVVGGTVLRGEQESIAQNNMQAGIELSSVESFQVLPATSRVFLKWKSAPEDLWDLSISGKNTQVKGGAIAIDFPAANPREIHTWTLQGISKPQVQLMGSWFYYQNIDENDSFQLLELLQQQKPFDQLALEKPNPVCQWMQHEMLINQNEYCVAQQGQ